MNQAAAQAYLQAIALLRPFSDEISNYKEKASFTSWYSYVDRVI